MSQFIRGIMLAALIAGCDEQSGTPVPPIESSTDGAVTVDGTDDSDSTDATDNTDATDGTDDSDSTDATDGGPQPGQMYHCNDDAWCYIDEDPINEGYLACFDGPAPRTGDEAYGWWKKVDNAFLEGANCVLVKN